MLHPFLVVTLVGILLASFFVSPSIDSFASGYRVAIQRGVKQQSADSGDGCVRNNTPGWCYPSLPWYDSEGKSLTPSLDSNGRLLSITNWKGKKLPLSYDTFGRLTSPQLFDAEGDVLPTDSS